MNLPTIIVLLIIVALMVLAVRFYRGGHGRCGCSSKCEGCALESCCCKDGTKDGDGHRKTCRSCCK